MPTIQDDAENLNEKQSEFPRSEKESDAFEHKYSKKQKGPEPLPLQREIPPQEPFPISALGPIMERASEKVVKTTKVADSICGGSFLSAVALCVQGHRDVHFDGRKYPLSEFFLSIAPSGDRKSAADRLALRSVRNYERENLKPEFDRLYKTWEDLFEAYIAKRKKLLRNPDGAESRLAEIVKPERPLDPFLICEEPTIAGLELLLFEGQPSIGLYSDEGGRFFGGFSMNKDNVTNAIAFLSKLWDGDPPSRVRKDQRFRLYGRRLASHLMLQPTIFNGIISNRVIAEQGILARYLIASPPSAGNTGTYNDANLDLDPSLATYWDHCNRILDNAFPLAKGKKNELEPLPIHLSSEAKKAWIAFYETIESELGPAGRYKPVYSFAKKIAEHAVRIAGILEVFEDLGAKEVSVNSMERGVTLAQWYLKEALRINGVASVDHNLELAQLVLEFLKKRKEKQFPLWVVYKDGPYAIRDKERAQQILWILHKHEYIQPIPDKKNWWKLDF